MKMPVEWHKRNLLSMKDYYEREKRHMESIMEALARLAKDIHRAEEAIERAEREGRTEYDADKFNVNTHRQSSY